MTQGQTRKERVKHSDSWGFPWGWVVKNLPANARDVGLIPCSWRSPGEGNGNPPQYSCLKNPLGPDVLPSMGLQRLRHDLVTEEHQWCQVIHTWYISQLKHTFVFMRFPFSTCMCFLIFKNEKIEKVDFTFKISFIVKRNCFKQISIQKVYMET